MKLHANAVILIGLRLHHSMNYRKLPFPVYLPKLWNLTILVYIYIYIYIYIYNIIYIENYT